MLNVRALDISFQAFVETRTLASKKLLSSYIPFDPFAMAETNQGIRIVILVPTAESTRNGEAWRDAAQKSNTMTF